MNIHSMIQSAASVASVLSVVVFGFGYYMMIRLYRESVRMGKETRAAGGLRPQVVVSAEYGRLPDVSLSVRNFTQAPAKDISFEFSAPVEGPDGTVISELPYFEKGLPFLEPDEAVTRFWGRLPELVPLMREKDLEDGIRVTTRYKDLAGESYETGWTLNPLLFEGAELENSKGMNDLVNAVERIPEAVGRRDGYLQTKSSDNA